MPRLIPVTIAQITPSAAVAIGSSLEVHSLVITADHANSGKILIGDSNLSTTRYMVALSAGESFSPPYLVSANGVETVNLADWYVLQSAATNKANVGYLVRA